METMVIKKMGFDKERKGRRTGRGFNYKRSDIIKLINAVHEAKIDLATDQAEVKQIAFSLHTAFKDEGRAFFHKLRSVSKGYNKEDVDKLWEHCAKSNDYTIEIGTLVYFAKEAGISFTGKKVKRIDGRLPSGSDSYKVPRNGSCPCGSGRKYKHCHLPGIKDG